MAILRHPALMHLCGYVGVFKGHPLYGKSYDEDEVMWEIEVHGGLTYADNHIPNKEPDGLWWFGFDCSHAGDSHIYSSGRGIYRDMEYVKSECMKLFQQLCLLRN